MRRERNSPSGRNVFPGPGLGGEGAASRERTIRYVTWREYIHTIADKPSKEWRFSMEDILTALPWGEKTIKVVAQQVRSAEEPSADRGKDGGGGVDRARQPVAGSAVPARVGRRALGAGARLLDYGDDASGTAGMGVSDRRRNPQHRGGCQIRRSPSRRAALARGEGAGTVSGPLGAQWLRVFNALAIRRADLAELTIDTDRGARGIRVFDAKGAEVRCQTLPRRRYGARKPAGANGPAGPGESINSATLLFRPQVPPIGYASYRIEPVYDAVSNVEPGSTSASSGSDGSVTLESDLYRLRLDPARGGAITSLYAKQLKREFCDPAAERLFNEYRGYFIAQKQWRSSAENPARIQITQNGRCAPKLASAGQVAESRTRLQLRWSRGSAESTFRTASRSRKIPGLAIHGTSSPRTGEASRAARPMMDGGSSRRFSRSR